MTNRKFILAISLAVAMAAGAAAAQVISQLGTAGTLGGGEFLVLVQNSTTVKTTLNAIGTFIQKNFPTSGVNPGTIHQVAYYAATGAVVSGNPVTIPIGATGNTVQTGDSNTVTNTMLAQGAANTVKGNPTGSTANEQDTAVPSCSTASSALTWTSGSGFGCNATIQAATVSARNPKMSVTSASASGTFTADQVVVMTALNGFAQTLPNYSQAINLATTGAGGMDTGSAPTSGYVALYAIAKADGTTSILACNVTTSSGTIYGGANMPAGYTYSGLIGIWPTDGSTPGKFVAGLVLDRRFSYQTKATIFTGTTGNSALTLQSISAGVPAPARTVTLLLAKTTAAPADWGVAADSTGTGGQWAGWAQNAAAVTILGVSATTNATFKDVPIITAQTIYWQDPRGDVVNNMYVSDYTW